MSICAVRESALHQCVMAAVYRRGEYAAEARNGLCESATSKERATGPDGCRRGICRGLTSHSGLRAPPKGRRAWRGVICRARKIFDFRPGVTVAVQDGSSDSPVVAHLELLSNRSALPGRGVIVAVNLLRFAVGSVAW